ncbi:MAG: mannose-1-phosphate guanylyltransferase/mannose-6-phosphate isomerase [Paracoccaceae bacterium]|nr:mannose-1-phosphate guanylyltransferase/mannose-6-phosphate isomerase [Paracoccaceae bacterium]
MSQIHPLILCGGSGTRLWPSSRKAFPKQFIPLVGEESLFQATLRRFTGPEFDRPLIVTGEPFRFLGREQAEALGLDDTTIILEPEARDTAPAILAAALTLKDTPEALMLVAPSDHMIEDTGAFLRAVAAGAEAARAGHLVTFGITPERAETGYGYLAVGDAPRAGVAQPVAAFVEKPDRARAEEMVAGGRHLWNGGIFLFRVQDILTAFETHAPGMVAPCEAALREAETDLGFIRLGAAYGQATAQSIDYAIMEKAEAIATVPVSAGWSDLGSWEAVRATGTPDATGTVTAGAATAVDCRNSYLRSEDDNLHLVGLGLDNMVAVAMRDAVLVAPMDRVQDVKWVVQTLEEKSVPQARDYPRFHRPWGWYETLCLGTRFQVKRIMVKPGGILSLQSHMHRSEHWIVVAGTARVVVGEEVTLVSENQSVYIPLGSKHRMENPGKVPMYLIEVQTGAYLGEDDIQRYEDVYQRS